MEKPVCFLSEDYNVLGILSCVLNVLPKERHKEFFEEFLKIPERDSAIKYAEKFVVIKWEK